MDNRALKDIDEILTGAGVRQDIKAETIDSLVDVFRSYHRRMQASNREHFSTLQSLKSEKQKAKDTTP